MWTTLFAPHAPTPPPASHAMVSDGYLQGLVIYEVIVLLVLGAFLRARGWTIERIGLKPTLRATVQGLALVLLIYLINLAVWVLVSFVWPDAAGAARKLEALFEGSLSLGPVLAVSIVNPVFEEVFVCAYIVSALKEKRGVAFAVNVSTALRVTITCIKERRCHQRVRSGWCSRTTTHGTENSGRSSWRTGSWTS
jgi:membrane protease YdiL (CAAX protease family)